MDPEYFKKDALRAEARISKNLKLGDLVLDGYRVVYESTEAIDRGEGEEGGLPYFLQSADISTPFINAESMICVAQSDWDRYPKGRIQRGELLIEVKGKAEKIALVPDDFPSKTLVSGTCFKLTTKNPDDRYFLAAYLTCHYGQLLKDRLKTNLLVSYLAKDDLYGLPVPEVSNTFKSGLRKAFDICFSLQRKANSQIAVAEKLLEASLGLENWQTPEPLTYARNSRDAFTTGRLDAEYFQPKYAKLTELIEATGQASPLANLLQTNQRGKQPEYAESGLSVVNSKHVANGEVRVDADNRYATSSDSSLLIEPGDVLINGTGVGTIGRAAPYLHSFKAIPDNHVTILRPHKGSIDPVYLAVFLNSLAGQLQVEQRFRGSSGQIELYPNDIAQFTIWVAPENIQAQVRQSVEASFQAKQRATQLLDAAKRAVEIAIENSEAAALAYLAGVNP